MYIAKCDWLRRYKINFHFPSPFSKMFIQRALICTFNAWSLHQVARPIQSPLPHQVTAHSIIRNDSYAVNTLNTIQHMLVHVFNGEWVDIFSFSHTMVFVCNQRLPTGCWKMTVRILQFHARHEITFDFTCEFVCCKPFVCLLKWSIVHMYRVVQRTLHCKVSFVILIIK